jgi:hypothetical protein
MNVGERMAVRRAPMDAFTPLEDGIEVTVRSVQTPYGAGGKDFYVSVQADDGRVAFLHRASLFPLNQGN